MVRESEGDRLYRPREPNAIMAVVSTSEYPVAKRSGIVVTNDESTSESKA
jgi:hypothetical protein